MSIFTFWEGPMPDYIKLCMKTWKFPYILLNYDNLNEYTDLKVAPELTRFTLPQIADCVRVHVLRDQGGYWLDADTIMLSDTLPAQTILGDNISRTNTIGMLHTEPGSEMFTEWARYQDNIINNSQSNPDLWSIMGNSFTDNYLMDHKEVEIGPILRHWPEVYMIGGRIPRYEKYRRLYFETSYHLRNVSKAGILMLHNSWTPDWYKQLSEDEVLARNCTLSNILKEILCNT